MTQVAIVGEPNALVERIARWLVPEHHVTSVIASNSSVDRVLDGNVDIVVVVADDAASARDSRFAVPQILRRETRPAVVVTGSEPVPPGWLKQLLGKYSHLGAVYPASPAALQVVTRTLLRRRSERT